MSDHAAIVREWIGGCLALHGFREDCPACVAYRDANAALDALVAERDEALGIELSEVMDDLRAAEAEVARLREALERISKLPLDEDESVAYAADKARREMQAIARAALDVPTKGISQGHMMDAKGEMGGYQG